MYVDAIGRSLIPQTDVTGQNHGLYCHQLFINDDIIQCGVNHMVLGENTIVKKPENRHTLGATYIFKVIIHDISHKEYVLSDLDLRDHRKRLLNIIMESCMVAVVLNDYQRIIINVSHNHRTDSQFI